MTIWIAYATAGREFDAQEACEAIGIRADVPRRVEMIRSAKRRFPEPVVTSYLPNYLFIHGPADVFHAIRDVKELRGTAWAVPQQAERAVGAFIARVEADFAARMAQIEAGQRVAEYEPGDLLTIMTGPFAGQLARFRRMVEAADSAFPRIEAVVDGVTLLGAEVRAVVDPVNAKRATA